MPDLLTQYLDGDVILIDKPLNWTSFDAVNYIRNCFRKTFGLSKMKIGHAGTLDPLATGLLIICTGKATKRIQEFQEMEKTYECTMDFSARTPSFDLETQIDKHTPWDHLSLKSIEDALPVFKGDIMQVPPTFSAIKVEGKRAYEHARKQREFKLEARQVTISDFILTSSNLPEVEFTIRCSKGTYIRSLARDLGETVGAGAYLTALRRTKIGSFNVDDAHTPQQFCERLKLAHQTS